MTGSKAAKVFNHVLCQMESLKFTRSLLCSGSSNAHFKQLSLTSSDYLRCQRQLPDCHPNSTSVFSCPKSSEPEDSLGRKAPPDPRLKGTRGKAPLTSASNSCYKTSGSSTFHRSAQHELYFTIPQDFTHLSFM